MTKFTKCIWVSSGELNIVNMKWIPNMHGMRVHAIQGWYVSWSKAMTKFINCIWVPYADWIYMIYMIYWWYDQCALYPSTCGGGGCQLVFALSTVIPWHVVNGGVACGRRYWCAVADMPCFHGHQGVQDSNVYIINLCYKVFYGFVGVACKVMHYISHSSRIMNMYCKAAYEVVEVAFKVIHYISIMYKMGFSPWSVNTSH